MGSWWVATAESDSSGPNIIIPTLTTPLTPASSVLTINGVVTMPSTGDSGDAERIDGVER